MRSEVCFVRLSLIFEFMPDHTLVEVPLMNKKVICMESLKSKLSKLVIREML